MSDNSLSELDYKKLFDFCLEYSDRIILILNNDFTLQKINRIAENTFGWKKDSFSSQRIDELFGSPEINPFEISKNRLRIKRKMTSHSRNGQKISISWELIPAGIKNVTLVTGEKYSEAERLDSFYLSNIIKYMPGFFYWKDTNSLYLGCNDEFAVLAGERSRQDVVGKTDYELIWKDRAAQYVAIDREVMQTGVARLEHIEKITVSGKKTITAITNKVPMKDDAGNIIGLLGITIDITRQKEIERALAVARKKAEDASRAKDEFIRNMSHDIRTPLSGIIGMSSILENEALSVEEREHAHMVHISGEQLLALLNSVLDIVASGQTENQLNLSTFNIKELIHSIADLELPTIKLKNLDLRISFSDDLPEEIESDQIKIHRILLNLLGNAVKFTQSGYIEIGARPRQTEKDEKRIELFIRDTGIGISEEEQDKIFRKFFRGTPSHHGIYTGHGVGLHIVKRYTQLLKGKIAVESKLGEGTTFTASIPVKIAKQTADKRISSPPLLAITENKEIKPEKRKKGIQILLIEDNAIALKTAENLLAQMSIGFQSASTGSRAIELFAANTFHLVLSDIGLPDMQGTDVTSHFRALERELGRTAVPVIGLTAHSLPDTVHEALQAGMNEVLGKPIRSEHIAYLIDKYKLDASPKSPKEECTAPNSHPGLPASQQEMFEIDQYPLFDEAEGTDNCGGERALRKLLKMMVGSELPADRAKMKKAFEESNFAEVERIAHKIKGGAVYIGTIRMKYACQYLERYWKSGDRELFEQLYHQATHVIDDTTACINQWLI